MKKLILFLFAATILTSCKTPAGFTTYTVKAGNHEMEGNRVNILKNTWFTFTVQTDSSWYWETPEKNGFSKVTGVGFFQGEYNSSARLVYINKNNNVHEFWSYFYANDMTPQEDPTLKKKLIDVEIGKAYFGKVGYVGGWLYVEVGGEHHSVKGKGHGTPYLQNPYIGGTYTIDHDWIVKLKRQ